MSHLPKRRVLEAVTDKHSFSKTISSRRSLESFFVFRTPWNALLKKKKKIFDLPVDHMISFIDHGDRFISFVSFDSFISHGQASTHKFFLPLITRTMAVVKTTAKIFSLKRLCKIPINRKCHFSRTKSFATSIILNFAICK
jgi:hypothetical protein